MMRFTNSQKIAGEMAMRELTADAQKWYASNDWFHLYVISDEDTPYVMTDCGGMTEAVQTIDMVEDTIRSYINEERENRIADAVDAIFAYDPYNGLLWHEMMEQFRAESDADIAKILENIIEEDESGETEELEEVLAQFQALS